MIQEYKYLLKAYQEAGGLPEIFKDKTVAHLIIHKNKVIGKNSVEGLIVEPKERKQGVDIKMVVLKNTKIAKPVHLCFGMLPKEGLQQINIDAVVEDNAEIKLLAHCIFPNAYKIIHKMDAKITIADNAYYEYNEVHFHGENAGVKVIPYARIKVGKNSCVRTNFSLLKGRVGVFDLDYETLVSDNSVLEMVAKIYGYGQDLIKIREAGYLKGNSSKGILKTRIAVKENADSQIINELVAEGLNSRGHVDCVEIIQGKAKAKAIPIVSVLNETAKITHEAAIGSVDKKQVETLMARGLKEEEAIDIVVSGLLK